ncbi:MAG: hypothetical protein QM271_01410 [Bacillota bacterium]|nr:hypothetical protein [Bacillota bacterium]
MKRSSIVLLAFILFIMLLCTGAQAASYTMSLGKNVEIYSGPGFAYGFVQKVGVDGVYTIVKEAYCTDGYLWGKLKSGVGWVRLSDSSSGVPYTTPLGAEEKIYSGPGFAYGYVKTVGEDGVYTIVKETYCSDGYLWGKLKSGVGWVRLSDSSSSVPYTTPLGAEEKIYSGPGFAYGFVKTVGVDGVYTIVKEAYCTDGYLWGKLKSGVGWVRLSGSTSSTPYTTPLGAEEKIYSGPGFAYGYVKTVGVDGVYTIVKEAYCSDGYLWGKLKSGVGWVRLSGSTSSVPYTTPLGAEEKIYSGPGFAYGFVQKVGVDGVYTIVEEAPCVDGYLWGKLKSGVGWVRLGSLMP